MKRIFFLLCFVLFSAESLFAESKIDSFIASARSQIGKTVGYDPAYRSLSYPLGDVPLETGVCTDVVIRAFRSLGFDLQKLVHEDIRTNFSKYPSKRIWGLKKPDRNIDHRRVPNLRAFFGRHGESFSLAVEDIGPGDLITWRLSSGVPHIGIVSNKKSPDDKRLLIIHNIGGGTQEEDVLNAFEKTGHYRFRPWESDS